MTEARAPVMICVTKDDDICGFLPEAEYDVAVMKLKNSESFFTKSLSFLLTTWTSSETKWVNVKGRLASIFAGLVMDSYRILSRASDDLEMSPRSKISLLG